MSSYNVRNRYNGARSWWGNIFGLDIKSLTEKQLMQISIEKLIEFVLDDRRVEKIIARRLKDCIVKEVYRFKVLDKKEIDNLPVLFEAYNMFVKYRNREIEEYYRRSYNGRSDYIIWCWLNDANKAREFTRFIKGEDNVISTKAINFPWLCEKYPWLANKVISKLLSSYKNNHYTRQSPNDTVPRMIINLPREFLIKNVDSIFKECGSLTSAFVLSNPYTPEDYIIKGLRLISGKIRAPNIKVKISKKILGSLPPMCRLGVLETLLLHTRLKIEFEDISMENLESLLFGPVIKHSERVRRVINAFKLKYERNR